MLKLRTPRARTTMTYVRVTDPETAPTLAAPLPAGNRDDLKIRNLLDDPRLRRAMGLDPIETVPVVLRPEPRFDRRRLLDAAA